VYQDFIFFLSSFMIELVLVADGWCWFVLREKYCWLVADKPSEQGSPLDLFFLIRKTISGLSSTEANAYSQSLQFTPIALSLNQIACKRSTSCSGRQRPN
jgi:hypothetical protein